MPRRRKQVFKDPDWYVERRGRPAANKAILTDELIAAAVAGCSERAIHDDLVSGLYVRIRPTGAKTYHYRQPGIGNKQAVLLGRAPTYSVAEARAAATRIRDNRAVGRVSRFSSGGPSRWTVAQAFEVYIAAQPPSEWMRRTERTFARLILPVIGSIKLAELDGDTALRPFTDLEDYYRAGTPIHILSAFLSWAVKGGHVRFNVLRGRISLPHRQRPRYSHITESGIGRFWRACELLPEHWRAAFRLMMASGRPIRSILALSDRSLVDWDGGGEVFSSAPTGLVDELLQPFRGRKPGFLFSAPGKTTPMKFQQRHWNTLREAAGHSSATMRDLHHGLRRQALICRDRGTRWDDFLQSCMVEPTYEEEVDL